MLAMDEKTTDYTHDIAYYAKDSRLTEPSDSKRYEWRKTIELSKELGRLAKKEHIDFQFLYV